MLAGEIWSMRRPDFNGFLSRFMDGELYARIEGKIEAPKEKPPYTLDGSVAVVPLHGVMMRNPDPIMRFFGATDTGKFAEAVALAVADPQAAAILLDVDSPGGSVSGTPEAAEAVRMARESKPVIAYTGGDMASAAYWVGCQADAVYASQSARVGSIGVYAVMTDMSKMADAAGIKVNVIRSGAYKGAGIPGAPITDDQMAQRQAIVDRLGAAFRADVVAGRGQVDAANMEGQEFIGEDGIAAGLVDAVTGYNGALADAAQFAVIRRAGR